MSKQLKAFEEFMRQQSAWTLESKTKELLNYKKVMPAQKGSCLVALILLFLMILPGLLYMYFARKPEKALKLSVSIGEDGTLTPSGDPEGMKLFDKFVSSQNTE